MNSLKDYILEKFQITKDSKLPYKYYPKDKFELREILEERLAEDKNADLNDIDVSEITDMGNKGFHDDNGLFEDLDPHNIKIDLWNVSKVEDMKYMFNSCENLNCDLSNWNISNVENMGHMFEYCENFNCDLRKWDVSKVKDIGDMFKGCKRFEGKGLENWKVSKVENMFDMFGDCENFNCDLSDWEVFKVKDMRYMFYNCKNFEGKGLENWAVSNDIAMDRMFEFCKSLKNKPRWYKG